MKIFLIILAIVYGLTSLFIFLLGIISSRTINYPETEVKTSPLLKPIAFLFLVIWGLLPILRWFYFLGIVQNYQEYGVKN